MPKLIVNAIDNDVHIQDPFPAEGALVIMAVPGTPAEAIVSWGQLQRLRPQLTQLEADGRITYTDTATGADTRADECDLVGLPAVGVLSALTAGGPVTGATIDGNDLLAGQTKATLSMAGGDLVFEAVIPGAGSNELSVEIVDGKAESVAVVGSLITITLNTSVSTYASILTTVNTDPATLPLVLVTTGVASVAVAEAETAFSGGAGDGIFVSVGGIDGVFTATSDISCTYDVDLTPLVAATTAVVAFRSGGKLTQVGVQLA